MKNLNVRMSDDLHARLKEAAEGDTRSLNGEIISMLEHALLCRQFTDWTARAQEGART